jgi:hypothetical protein
MSAQTITLAPSSTATSPPKPAIAARTKLLLEGPILPTLLRLSAPNVLNLLAIAGMITFDGLFMGRLGADAWQACPWPSHLSCSFSTPLQAAWAAEFRPPLPGHSCRQARRSQRARPAHSHPGFRPCGGVFDGLAGSGADCFSLDGRPRRHAHGRNKLCQRGIQRRHLNLHAEFAGSVVRGTGNMALPAAVIVFSVLAHILISPLLIFGWGPLPALGPAGAGWGLMASFGAGSLVLLAYLRSHRSLVTLTFRGVRLSWPLFADILKVGVPGLINVIITNLSVVLLTALRPAGQGNRNRLRARSST